MLGCARDRAGPGSSAFFEAKGVRIHYVTQGTGEAVVLIHGLYSSAQLNWQGPGIVAALAHDHRVVALDLPGHGRSDRPLEPTAYGQQMVDDVVLLLDHLSLPRAHVVGYSMGGIVALKLIAQHPDRVVSGALGGMGWLREGGGLQKVWEHLPMGPGRRTPEACVRGIAELALTEEAVRAIKTPVLVLIGDRDPVQGLYVAPLQAVRNDWAVIKVPGAGHVSCVVNPAFRDELVKWIAENRVKS